MVAERRKEQTIGKTQTKKFVDCMSVV